MRKFLVKGANTYLFIYLLHASGMLHPEQFFKQFQTDGYDLEQLGLSYRLHSLEKSLLGWGKMSHSFQKSFVTAVKLKDN